MDYIFPSEPTDDDLRIGEAISGGPAIRPSRTTLEGKYVSLVPLDPATHGDVLFDATAGRENEKLWLYLSYGPFADRLSFERDLQLKAKSDDPLYFAILDSITAHAVGWTALLRFDSVHRVVEVGHILYTPALQRTRGATEATYLLARHVFENLGYRRFEWKCNALNAPSRRAALRLGFTFEGLFRQHMIVKGRNRDSAWFSMLDSDWPMRKTGFERWLNADNFDETGQQKTPLVVREPDDRCEGRP
jgi:RimJ/RimL family protein N-acetyltransferase